jgi:glycerol-3-phosphate cytidylyltransferase-like family protein
MNKGTRDFLSDASSVLSRMCYVVEVFRGGEWHIVGQYTARYNADAIARDYEARGEKTRVTYE